jgi:hypothetical protein
LLWLHWANAPALEHRIGVANYLAEEAALVGKSAQRL